LQVRRMWLGARGGGAETQWPDSRNCKRNVDISNNLNLRFAKELVGFLIFTSPAWLSSVSPFHQHEHASQFPLGGWFRRGAGLP
jgi:hypothetical protein